MFYALEQRRSLRSSAGAQIIHDPIRHQTRGDQRPGDASAGVGARADEVQVVIVRMAVVRAQIAQLRQGMRQPVRCTLHQVVTLAPRQRRVVDLELQMALPDR